MSHPNGLTSGNQCYRTGASLTNIYMRKGDNNFDGQVTVSDATGVAVLDASFLEIGIDNNTARFEIFSPAGNVQLSSSAGSIGLAPENGNVSITNSNANIAEFDIDTTGRLTCSAQNSILLVPNVLSGAATDGIVFQDGSATSMLIAPSSVGIQLVSQSIPGLNLISGQDSATLQVGAGQTGVINLISMTTTGTFVIQFAGSNCIPGTFWDFFVAGNGLVGATSVVFENNSVQITSVVPNTIPAGTAFSVRIFTPDGTNFLLIKQNPT